MTDYYVDDATGDDSDTGLTEALAFATLQQAADTVAAGDIVYVKNTNTYNERFDLATDGTNIAPVRWIGYETTITDGGVVTIDAQNTRDSCMRLTAITYQWFKNFTFTGATTSPLLQQTNGTSSQFIFENCTFTDGSGSPSTVYTNGAGIYVDIDGCVFDGCIVENMSGNGIQDFGTNFALINCIVRDNGGHGWVPNPYDTNCKAHRCAFYDNGNYGINASNPTTGHLHLTHCTFDGNTDGGVAVRGQTTFGHLIKYCLFTNHTGSGIGIYENTALYSGTNRLYCDWNAFYNNNTHTSGRFWVDGDNDIVLTSDPYTDASGHDYTLNNTAGGGADLRNVGACGESIGKFEPSSGGGSSRRIFLPPSRIY